MSLGAQLQNHFPDLDWQLEAPLAPLTYMKIGGPAEVLWRARSIDDFKAVIRYAKRENIPLTILGGASNVVIRDGGLRGLVIFNECDQVNVYSSPDELKRAQEGINLSEESTNIIDGHSVVLAQSGIRTSLLVRQTIDAGLTGLEPFLGVPGTLGGAVYNNSHYTQELIGNYIAGVEIVSEDGEVRWLANSECEFSYDHSRFHHRQEVITRVLFALKPGEAAASLEKVAAATRKRSETQPLGSANSGCMFQNVVLTPAQQERFGKNVLSAGWLIDQAGLKGQRVGKAVVSDKHANFVINEGGATFRDVEELVRNIQREVEKKFGLRLRPEVFFIGEEEKGS
jgi:UDP-N-acetylmuramate dehydrogenase